MGERQRLCVKRQENPRAGGELEAVESPRETSTHPLRPLASQPEPPPPRAMSATRQKAGRSDGNINRREQETELRDRAKLSQERRLKQATQFVHKDSADLLPLDSLKRLGTSKDLQPHSVIQHRLMEGNLNQLLGKSPLAWGPVQEADSGKKTNRKETPALLVHCKCRDQVLRVAVDTGTQHNQISAKCLSRLGLGEGTLKAPGGKTPGPLTHVEQLELQLGQEIVACSAQVVVLY